MFVERIKGVRDVFTEGSKLFSFLKPVYHWVCGGALMLESTKDKGSAENSQFTQCFKGEVTLQFVVLHVPRSA